MKETWITPAWDVLGNNVIRAIAYKYYARGVLHSEARPAICCFDPRTIHLSCSEPVKSYWYLEGVEFQEWSWRKLVQSAGD